MNIERALHIADSYSGNAKVGVAAPEHEAIVCLAAEVRRLHEENERLRKDAERYQWLRELVSSKDGTIQAQGLFWNCSHSRRKLDAAIDAAWSAKALPEPAP